MKRIKKCFILIFFILLFMPLTLVKADSFATCADVVDAITELDDIDAMYEELDCDNATSNADIHKCNNLRIKKASVLEKIFEYNEEKVCPSIDLSEIIAKYSDSCSNRFSSEIKEYADKLMRLFFMAAPFILIIFGSLDFFKIIAANDPKEIKKSRTNFIKRLAAFILLLLTPAIVHFLFSLTPYDMDGNSFVCSQELILSSKTTVGEISGIYGGNNYGGGGQAIAEAAKEVKEYIKDNGYFYGYELTWGIPADRLATPEQGNKQFCCATLIRVALYRGGIYTVDETKFIESETAGAVAQALYDKGWTVIWDADKLEPGDVLVYDRPGSSYYSTYIEGHLYHVGHVDIYYGDGKKVSTGDGCRKGADGCPSYGGFKDRPTLSTFNSAPGTTAKQGFLCGLRYPGKK